MARLEKFGWSACKEFQETSTDEIFKQLPRIKTLTRATKKNIDSVKKNVKEQLPVLTSVGIRRYRLPYHECVLLELNECGMTQVAQYIEQLFQINDNFINNNNNNISLKFQNDLIKRLQNNLINAEIAKRENNYLIETTILFETIEFFQLLSSQWCWIVDQLFKKTLTSAKMISNDNGLIINIIKFTYGQFLFQRMNDPQGALHYLIEVRDISEGKNWNASKFLKIKHDNIYKECNILLYEIYRILSENLRFSDGKKAVKTSLEALKCANDSENNVYIAKALYQLGKNLMIIGDMTGGLKIFAKFLAIVKRIPDYKSICDGHKQLAIAHQNLKDDDGTRKHFRLFTQCANENKLTDKFAQAHYLTGQYLLQCGFASDASEHLTIAFNTYENLKMQKEMDESRYLLGISKGEQLIEEYMKLILNCGNNNKNETLKLLQWKNKRIPFWSS